MRPHTVLIFLSLTGYMPLANACKIFKNCHKGKPLKHIENGIHDLGDNAANIISLGSQKRQQERKEAAEAERRMNDARRNAAEKKQAAIESAIAQIANAKTGIAKNETILVTLKSVQQNLNQNIKLSQALLESAKGDSVKSAKVIQLVVSQQNDLLKNLDAQKSDDPRYTALVTKVRSYSQQLKNFPGSSATEQDLDNLATDLSEQHFETIAFLNQAIENLSNQITYLKNNLSASEKNLAQLQNPTTATTASTSSSSGTKKINLAQVNRIFKRWR